MYKDEKDWTEEEHVLLIDLYFRCDERKLDQKHSLAVKLSRELRYINKLNGIEFKSSSFRSPDAVAYKIRATYEYYRKIHNTATSDDHINLLSYYKNNYRLLLKHTLAIIDKYDLNSEPYDNDKPDSLFPLKIRDFSYKYPVELRSEGKDMTKDIINVLYIFLDEGGNLDFSERGTKYFTLSSLSKLRPFEAYRKLNDLKYDLIEENNDIEYFHASEDRQIVRDEVFTIINKHFKASVIDSIIVNKSKIDKAQQDAVTFYTSLFGQLIQNILKFIKTDDFDKIIIFTDSIPVKKKAKAIEKGIKLMLASELKGKVEYLICHHQSKSNYDLQLTDYCNWAIFRKCESNDDRSYKLIKKYIRTEKFFA